jgi:hypothetical protein
LPESGSQAQTADQQANAIELNLMLILKGDAIRPIDPLKAGF